MSKVLYDKQAWRKLAVRRDRRHEPLVQKLCSGADGSSGIFTFNKDLMVFAAMVGYKLQKRTPLSPENIQIVLETYASDQKDAYIYLLGLVTQKEASILKDENLTKAIKIFEEYCNSGLDEIKLWLDENPSDPSGVLTLNEKIYEQVKKNRLNESKEINHEEIELEF